MADGSKLSKEDRLHAVVEAYAAKRAADVYFLQALTAAADPHEHLTLDAMLEANAAGDSKKLHALMRRYVKSMSEQQRTTLGPIDTPELPPE